MKPVILSILLLFVATYTNSQNLYIKTFGNANNKAVIFLHGGPGYNCVNFEATTAQQLANNGFFVIVYDRRGEGRSKDPGTKYTFTETFADLQKLYEKYGLKQSILIGHSFGGVVAILFANQYPEIVQSVILVGAPVSLQETFKNIIAKLKSRFESKKDSVNLRYITMLATMDTTRLEYSSNCFLYAMRNGFYSPKEPTDESKSIYAKYRADTSLSKYASQMSYAAAYGFWKNEKYTTIDLVPTIKKLLESKTKIYGLYGKDDGLYSKEQVEKLQDLIGIQNLKYLDHCSHNVFIDQQTPFIEAIKTWTK